MRCGGWEGPRVTLHITPHITVRRDHTPVSPLHRSPVPLCCGAGGGVEGGVNGAREAADDHTATTKGTRKVSRTSSLTPHRLV